MLHGRINAKRVQKIKVGCFFFFKADNEKLRGLGVANLENKGWSPSRKEVVLDKMPSSCLPFRAVR